MMEEVIRPQEETVSCQVCDMPIPDPAKAYTEEYHGEPYLLCSSDCLKEFLLDPEKYLVFEEEEGAE